MIILGIESSCDETAAAIVDDGKVICDVVASQDEIHSPFGGVVPELAARAHMERVAPLVKEALSRADIGMEDIDGVAVTTGPGLVVCLLVGIQAAKGIALGRGIPLIGVNHLDGHLSAIFIDQNQVPPEYPYIGLIVSGGHTSLYLVTGPGEYKGLGHTLDDAAGEAFDKCAKVLGLPYPGGREIEKTAKTGDPTAIAFPRPILSRDNFDFSFSGLKTSVINYWKKNGENKNEIPDIAASFQAACVDVLVKKSLKAAKAYSAKQIVASGGVAANGALRASFESASKAQDVEVKFPSIRLCTDNAAMIAYCGYRSLMKGTPSGLDVSPRAVWPLE